MYAMLCDEALAYAARGWPVFPLKPRSKTPLTAHGLLDATTDPKQINEWWTRWPAANIGLDCGRAGLVVIDVDTDKGGLSTWAALDPHVPTLTSRTGGGGFHIIYALLAGQKPVHNSAGRLGPGLDVRAAGGYIVLPPSVHPSGAPLRVAGSQTAEERRACCGAAACLAAGAVEARAQNALAR